MNDPAIPSRLLFGPGPSPVSARVMRAMSAPVLGHLDPAFVSVLDEIRSGLARLFRAAPDGLALAVPGTGSAGIEAAVANLVVPDRRVLVVVGGYFGERLADVCSRYGAAVARVENEWGRAADPERVRAALREHGAEIVAFVHAETSTGVLNPAADLAAVAQEAGALTIVDAVTSLGAHPVEAGAWRLDACYSCTQKGLGAPSGLAPLAVSRRALDGRVPCRSFYLDLRLLEAYWLGRKYHHTLSAPLIYALHAALAEIEDEGLDARWTRHRRHHLAFCAGLEAMGLGVLPPAGERLWTLHAVKVPDGVDEAAVRRFVLERFDMEVGAGLGPLAGRIWRIGLMGAGSTDQNVLLLLGALECALRVAGFAVPPGAGTAAAVDALTAPAT